jgi:hypothetical protein
MQTDDEREKKREYNRRYREKHPERVKEQQRAYRERTREQQKERVRAWRDANPEYGKRYYQENKERLRKREAEYYKKNREHIKERNKRYASTPEAKRRRRVLRLAKQYGITYEQYTEMAEAQGWTCAACGGEPNGLGLVVDHHHGNGRVRGLLCSRCNSALGLIDDSLDKAKALVAYLKRYRDDK